jgi:hypothetical protein
MNFRLEKDVPPFMLCLCFVAQTSLKKIWLRKQKEKKKNKSKKTKKKQKKKEGREVCSACNVQMEMETKSRENYQIKLIINALHFQSRFHKAQKRSSPIFRATKNCSYSTHSILLPSIQIQNFEIKY